YRSSNHCLLHSFPTRRSSDLLGLFGWKVGLAFQIMDDVLDICGDNTGKQQAKDVVEHKLGNAAIIVALRFLSAKKGSELRRILRDRKSTRLNSSHDQSSYAVF